MSKGKKYYNKWQDNNTLIGIFIGSNDVNDINYINNNKNITENMNDIIDIIFNTIENMYNVGIRNFMIINIPPFDLSPVNAKNKRPFYKHEVPMFNNALNENSKSLYWKFNDINIIVYDNYNEYKYIMENFKLYNFKSKTDSWYFNKNDKMDNYFWRDFTHISNKGHKILAEDINDLLSSINK